MLDADQARGFVGVCSLPFACGYPLPAQGFSRVKMVSPEDGKEVDKLLEKMLMSLRVVPGGVARRRGCYETKMRTKPKIAIVGSFPIWLMENDIPRPGGHYAVWLMALFEGLKQVEEYELHWVCMCKGIRRPREVYYANQFFHVLPAGSLELSSRTHYLWDRFRLRRVLNRIRPDIVHAWGTESRWAVCTYSYPAKKILSMQGVLTAYHRLCPLGAYMLRQARMEPRLLPCYDVITSESEWGCARCREISPASKVVRWEYAAEERFFHVQRQLSPEPTCLMAGSDSAIKNVDTAVRAFSAASLSHVTLLLAGVDPAQRPNLPPNVKALGRVSRERMAELLASSWALVHPTLADTSPNIVKEARVVGLPVVTTTECGGAQYVEDGKSGYVIEARDVAALQKAVLNMTMDAGTALRMGAWRQEECRQLLGREMMVRRLMEIYGAVLAGGEAALQ